jgi:hypothetical protein
VGCGRIGTFVITVDIATQTRNGVILAYALRNWGHCNNDAWYKELSNKSSDANLTKSLPMFN